MRWGGHVARILGKRNAYRILARTQKVRNHWEDQEVGRWTILKLLLER
jgi:hypothetical protein